jgi:hypothetical protein
MPRLTITLSEERHRALKEAAAKRHQSIASLIEESLDFYGIKSGESAAELVTRARSRSVLSEDEALGIAEAATRATRAE